MRRVALAFLVFLTLSACGADKGGSATGDGSADTGGPGRAGGSQAEAPRNGGGGAAAAPESGRKGLTDVVVGRATIRTGEVSVRVPDVLEAARSAVALAERAGGYLEAERTNAESTVLTLRVPPEDFTAVSDAVARLGTVEDRTVATEDVTGDVADVEGRVKAARVSTERVRGLLARATTISEITTLESELNEREAALESLETRRRALAGKTAFASLTVTFARPVLAAPAPRAAPAADAGFGAGLRAGWRVFVTTVTVLLVILGAVLPFAGAALAVGVPVYLIRRRVTARA